MANQPKKYKKFVATAATATLVASAIVPVASAASLSDIAGNTHEEAIKALVDAKVISGYPDGTFKPNKTLTRSDVVKLLGKYLETEGYAPAEDYKESPAFNDLKRTTNVELLKYASIVKEAGVFNGSNGNLLAGDNITRENMAITLVRMVNTLKDVSLEEYVDAQDFKGDVKDLTAAKAEARSAIKVLDFYDITNPAVANFNPKGDTTRGQFASFLYKTINTDFAGASATTGTVTAINNTTVEVTFGENIDDIKALKFAIEGLEVNDAVVKQTDKKTAVLTTSPQTAGVEYTVSVNGNKVGKFTGVSAVIPKSVKFATYTEASKQGVIGKEVTLKAQVTVEEGQSKAGIPVTFNIVNSSTNNEKKEVEVKTDENGVASYTYTRYYNGVDSVAAYATQKSTVVGSAKVYWANATQLEVSEITTGNDLANETKKTYKVSGAANTTYQVAIQENINVAPDKVTQVKVQNHGSQVFVTPYELTTGANQFATVTTNAKGEGTFTIYGTDLTATPVVYSPEKANKTYSATDLQSSAPTVKFSKVDRLALTVKAEGTADSAEYATVPTVYNAPSVGGRTYTATVTDKDGKLAPEGTIAYVTFEEGNYAGDVYFTTATENFQKVAKGSVFPVRVGKEGKATFRVAGKGATTYAKPTVFLNTAGVSSPVALDKGDVQQVGEVTYFKDAVVVNATLKVTDEYGRTISSLNAGKEAFFTYQSVDQNGFAYRPTAITTGSSTVTIWAPVYGKDANGNQILLGYEQKTIQTPGTSVQQYNLAFDVTSTFGNATVKDAAGKDINPSQNLGNTKTYQVVSDAEGKAIVRVTSSAADTVSVNVTGASNFLPTQTASVTFVNSAIVPNVYSGDVATYNSQEGTLSFVGKNPVSIFGDNVKYTKGTEVIANYDAFISLLANATGSVSITRTVGTDGIVTFNIYNISTSGIKPVDTAVSNPGAVALEAAKVAAAKLVAAEYTAESYKAVTDALAKEAAATTDAQKAALAKEINDAIAALVKAPEAIEGLTITTFTSAANSFGITVYTVEGTVASGSAEELKLTVEYTDGTTTEVTATDVTFDGKSFTAKFNELVLGDGTVKSVKIGTASAELK